MKRREQGSPDARAFELLVGLATTQILIALTRLNIIKTLGQGSRTLDELATTCKVQKHILFRVLRYARYFDIVAVTDAGYSLTDVGSCFLNGRPESLIYSMGFVAAPPWRDSWNHFSHTLKTGEPAFNNVFHQPFFEYLDTNPEYGKPFHEIMSRLTESVASQISESYNFGAFKTVCDIGGGQGVVLRSILQRFSSCEGILFDTEAALQFHVMGELMQRTKIIAGNFFHSIPNADCMVLKTVIHNWSDQDSIKILTNCRNALNEGGKLLLVELLVEEPFELSTLFFDMYMQTILGGAERTEEEYRFLLASAGLQLDRVVSTNSSLKIIEASVLK